MAGSYVSHPMSVYSLYECRKGIAPHYFTGPLSPSLILDSLFVIFMKKTDSLGNPNKVNQSVSVSGAENVIAVCQL